MQLNIADYNFVDNSLDRRLQFCSLLRKLEFGLALDLYRVAILEIKPASHVIRQVTEEYTRTPLDGKSENERSRREKYTVRSFSRKALSPFVARRVVLLLNMPTDLYLLIARLALYESACESRSINVAKNNSLLPD